MTTAEKKTAPAPRSGASETALLSRNRFTALAPGAQGVTLKVVSVTGTDITLTFNSMAGNQPSTYGHTAFLWQNGPAIPYDSPPFRSTPVTGNSPAGSINFHFDVKSEDYIVGYATGPSVKCIAAWAYIPAAGSEYEYFQTATWIIPNGVTPEVAIAEYETPDGYNPATNQNWAGIWKGPGASYTQQPQFRGNADSSSSGRIPIAGTYARTTQYTVGYFMGPALTTLAATYTFTT